MFNSPRCWALGMLVGLWVYFLLPSTAFLFYELYHLTGLDAVYWGYSGLRLGDYYLGLSGYKLLTCVVLVLVIAVLPGLFKKRESA